MTNHRTRKDAAPSTAPTLETLEPRLLLSAELYVAPWGSDAAAGTINAPFATVEAAQDAIRDLRSGPGLPDGGVTVYLRGGTYPRGSTFELTYQDSGQSDKPIVYRAYGNEDVRFIGGVTLDDDWFRPVTSSSPVWDRLAPEARGNVLVADLTSHGITDLGRLRNRAGFHGSNLSPSELFLDGQAMVLGRTEDWMTIAGTPYGRYAGTFTYTTSEPDNWTQAEDIWYSGLWGSYWLNELVDGSSINPSTNTITLGAVPDQGTRLGYPFYALNLLEEVDTPGEYYINRDTGKLYFWAPGQLSSNNQIYLSQMDSELLEMRNVSYVSFEGITFEAGRGSLVTISGGAHNRLYDCILRNAGGTGATISGRDNGLEYCQVYDVGERGVLLTGGDRPSLTPGENYVRNTDLHGWGRWVGTTKIGIHVEGIGQIVSHNHMHDAPSGAIWYYGNEHLIEYNDIHNIMSETADAGAIYAGRDWSFQGNVIQYNFIHDMSSPFTTWELFGVYLDDAVSSATVHGNIFYNLGYATLNLGGRYNIFTNNVIANCYGGHRADRRGVDITTNIPGHDCNFLEKLNEAAGGNYQTGAWAQAYPHVAEIPNNYYQLGDHKNPVGSVFSRNIGYDLASSNKWISEGSWGGYGAFDWYAGVEDNLYGSNPRFADEANRDMTLLPSSPAYTIPGFEPIPFDEIGIESGAPAEPADILLVGGGQVIANGDNTPSSGDGTYFGPAQQFGPAVDHTFIIGNTGERMLTVNGLDVSGAAAFEIVHEPDSSVQPGGSSSFVLRMSTGSTGTHTATVTLITSDPDTPVFTFTIRGSVTEQPGAGDEIIVDNTDAGFSAVGDWEESSALDEYGGSSFYANDVGARARWTPRVSQAATYDVYVWYSAAAPYGGTYDRDSAAEYVVHHAGGTTTVTLDQDVNSGQWVRLGGFAFSAGTEGYVELTRDSSNGVATSADAVRFVTGEPSGPVEVVVDDADPDFSTNGEWKPSSALDEYGEDSLHTNEVGASATWEADLPRSGTYEVYAWWSAKAPWGGTYDRDSEAMYVIEHAGGSDAVTVDQDVNSGQWVLLGTYEFRAGTPALTHLIRNRDSGVATSADAIKFVLKDSAFADEVIVDDIDVNFATTGQWDQSDALDEYKGSSLYTNSVGATARWTPEITDAGTYQVYAWWSAEAPWGGTYERDTSAEYTIHHAGGTSTVTVDQTEVSGQWVLLGTYAFDSGTDGYVQLIRDTDNGIATSADAVRFISV